MTDSFDLRNYLARAAAIAEPIFAARADRELDEQAGPAYFRGVSISRWIFWKRINACVGELPRRGESCLDFGCGFGMLLPLLSARFERVYGVDLMPDLSREFLARWNEAEPEMPSEAAIASSLDELNLPPQSLDCITALDVLEHIEELPALLERFRELLKPEGRLIVSGPTESRLYRLGRRIVGFSGDYHVSDIHRIRRQMEDAFDVRIAKTILPVLPLFHLLRATPSALPQPALSPLAPSPALDSH